MAIQTVSAVSITRRTGQGYNRTTLQAHQAKIEIGDIFALDTGKVARYTVVGSRTIKIGRAATPLTPER